MILSPRQIAEYRAIAAADAMQADDYAVTNGAVEGIGRTPITAADGGKIADEMLARALEDAASHRASALEAIRIIRELRHDPSKLEIYSERFMCALTEGQALDLVRLNAWQFGRSIVRAVRWLQSIAENTAYEQAVTAHFQIDRAA